MTWATQLVPACRDLRDRLAGAGIPATLDRSSLPVPGAFVTPASGEALTLKGAGRLTVNILLVVQPAGDLEALTGLAELLAKTLTVLTPDGPVDTSVVFPHNNNLHPAFRVPVVLKLEKE